MKGIVLSIGNTLEAVEACEPSGVRQRTLELLHALRGARIAKWNLQSPGGGEPKEGFVRQVQMLHWVIRDIEVALPALFEALGVEPQ